MNGTREERRRTGQLTSVVPLPPAHAVDVVGEGGGHVWLLELRHAGLGHGGPGLVQLRHGGLRHDGQAAGPPASGQVEVHPLDHVVRRGHDGPGPGQLGPQAGGRRTRMGHLGLGLLSSS